jgi:hypothetical protein
MYTGALCGPTTAGPYGRTLLGMSIHIPEVRMTTLVTQQPPATQSKTPPRLVAATGLLAGVLIFAAPMADTSAGTVGWIAGIVLLLPFFAGLAAVFAAGSAGDNSNPRWLTSLVSSAVAVGVGLHLTSLGVAHVAGTVAMDSPAHEPLHAVETTLFALALLPLGLALASIAAAIVLRRGGHLWLGILSGIVAAVLVANGANLGTEEVPGLMALLLWIFVADRPDDPAAACPTGVLTTSPA